MALQLTTKESSRFAGKESLKRQFQAEGPVRSSIRLVEAALLEIAGEIRRKGMRRRKKQIEQSSPHTLTNGRAFAMLEIHVSCRVMTPQVLAGKAGVVFGVANKRSIAWAIAKAWSAAGANLIFNYQGERLKENVEELVGEFGEKTSLFPCDVSSDDEIKAFFEQVRGETDRLDLMLHSLAFAPKEALEGDFVSTTREAFRTAHDISAYSLVTLAREAAPLMTNGGSIVAMTYYGAEKVVPHYNVMGVAKASLEASMRYLAYDLGPKKIRVNCISAGPVNTLAARGISGFMSMLKHYQERAPLKRSCDPAELGQTGVFLASDGAAAITGQVIYVDGGYQIMGM
jgi:enoyl-[acyl-carrier protein] reductase I